MLKNESCNVLCSRHIPGGINGPGDGAFINDRIIDSYNLNWLIDGLPAARVRVDPTSRETFYSVGFELGSVEAGTPQINNHYNILVDFHVFPMRLNLVMVACGERSVSGCGGDCDPNE